MLGDPLAPGTSPSLHSPCILSRLRPGHGSANVALPRKMEWSWGKLPSPRPLASRLFLFLQNCSFSSVPTPFLPL